MQHSVVILTILSLLLIASAQNWRRAGTTRYWDCSKPHCAWHGLAPNTNPPFAHENAFQRCNNCPHGARYYGTAAAATSIMGGSNQATAACGKCYALRAVGSSQAALIVKVNNLCPGDSNQKCKRDHFDIAVPGFDWNAFSVSNTCRQNDPAILYVNNEQACMRTAPRSCNCDRVSTSPRLVQGCKLFSELGWDNQEVDYTEVACPSGSQLGGSGSSPRPPAPPSPRPPAPPSPRPAPSSGNCNGVSVAFNPSERYWVEINAPAGRNVQLQCTGRNAHTAQCTYQWGKYTCKPNGECVPDSESARYAIVNGARCRLSGPARAEADFNDGDEFTAELNVETDFADAAVADYNEIDPELLDTQYDAAFADSQLDGEFVDYAVADEAAQLSGSQESATQSTPAWAIVVIAIAALTVVIVVVLAVALFKLK